MAEFLFEEDIVALMFRAYVAGFLASHEGFNGEYPYDDGEKDPSADLREGFDYWLAHNDGSERCSVPGCPHPKLASSPCCYGHVVDADDPTLRW